MVDDIKAIDAVVNLWTADALAHRPDWAEGFFVGKMKADASLLRGLPLARMLDRMDEAGTERALLIAAKAGRLGLPGCYHLPPDLVSDAVAAHPDRFSGLLGIDPFMGMEGVRELEDAVKNRGFIGAHFYPHWFELAPDHAKCYPFYAKCCELGIPMQVQVGQSMIYAKELPCRSTGQPIRLDAVACDFPELKLIGIHIGIPWADEMIAMAWKHEHVYIGADAHSPKYWPRSFINYLNSYGQDKVMFGTDFPVLDFARARREVDALRLKSVVRRKLLRDNAQRIYNLE